MEDSQEDENLVRKNRRRSVRNLRRQSGIQPLNWNIGDENQQALTEVDSDIQKQQELYGSLWLQTAEPVVKKRRRQSSQITCLPLHRLADEDEQVPVKSDEIEEDIKVPCSTFSEAYKLTTYGEENLSIFTQPIISSYIIPSRTSVHDDDCVSSMLNDTEKELDHFHICPSVGKKSLTPHEEDNVSKSTLSSISPLKLDYNVTLEESHTDTEFENISSSKTMTNVFDKPSRPFVTKVTSSPHQSVITIQNLNILEENKFSHSCNDNSVSVVLPSLNPSDGSKISMSSGNNCLDKDFVDNIEKFEKANSNLLTTRVVENIVANSVYMPILKEGNQKNVLVSNSDKKFKSKPDIEAMIDEMEAQVCKDDKSEALHLKLTNFSKHKKPTMNVRTWSDVGKLTSKENNSMQHTEVKVPIRVGKHTSCMSKNVEKPPCKLIARRVDRVGKKSDQMLGNTDKTAFEILNIAHKTHGDVKSYLNKVSSYSEAGLSKKKSHRKMFHKTFNDVTYDLNKMAKSCITETDDRAKFLSTASKGFISDKSEKVIANSDDLNHSVQTILIAHVNDCKGTIEPNDCNNANENFSDAHHGSNSVCAAQPELHSNNAEQIFLQDTNSESVDDICGKLEINFEGNDKNLSVIPNHCIDESPRLNLNQTHTIDSTKQNNAKSGMCLAERDNDMAKILLSDCENIVTVRKNSLIDNKLFKWKKRRRALQIPNNVADEIEQSFANLNPYIDPYTEMKTSTDNQKIFDLQTNGHSKVQVKKAKLDENVELGDFVTRRKNGLPKGSSKLVNACTITSAATYLKNGFDELLKEEESCNLDTTPGEEPVNSVEPNKMDMFNSIPVGGAVNFEVESNIITQLNGELIQGNAEVNDMLDDKFVDRKLKNKLLMIETGPSESFGQKIDKRRLTNCRRMSSKFEIIYEVAETSETNAHLFDSSGNACVKQKTIQSVLEKNADIKDHLNIKLCLNGRKHLKPSSDSEGSTNSTFANNQAEIENARLKTRYLSRNCLSDDIKVVHSPKKDLDFDSDISKQNMHENAGRFLNDESSKDSPGDGLSQIAADISQVSLEDKLDCSHFSVTNSCAQPEVTVENLELPDDTVHSFSKQIVSGRSRRRSAETASLKIQLQMKGPEDNIKANDSHISIPGQSTSTKLNLKHKLTRETKKETDEDLENVYKNKNFVKPEEKKPWQTIFESSENIQAAFGKKHCPRFIEFEKPTQMKLRKRLQRAIKNGWDPKKKRKASIPDDVARSKLDRLWSELDSDDVS